MSVLPALAAALMLQSPAATADDLGWMAGYWLDCSNGREAAETWMRERVHALGVERGQRLRRVLSELSFADQLELDRRQ